MVPLSDALANNLRNIREGRNLSLDGLSELTGVSKSMLRQIEVGQSNPTITTLWRIANGLHLPFTALLRDQPAAVTLQAFKDNAPLEDEAVGYSIYPLIFFSPERPFEVYYAEIEPGTLFDAEPHEGNTEEHVFVVQGRIAVSVASKCYDVGPEGMIGFRANCAHSYHNTGDERAVALMLISYLP